MERRLRAAAPLVLIVVAATLALSSWMTVQRPSLQLDLGEGRDHLSITGFHAREISALGSPSQFDWPRGLPELSVPSGADGVLTARLIAAPDADPSVIERGSAVTVNGVRVAMPRRSSREILVKVPAELAAAPTLRFALVSALVGDPPPPSDQIAAVEIAPAWTYRWTSGFAGVKLPHVGRGSFAVTLDAALLHPDGSFANADLLLNGRLWVTLPDAPSARRYHLLAPAELVGDGQLAIDIIAATYRDPRPLGLLISNLTVDPLAPGRVSDWLPSATTFAALLLPALTLLLLILQLVTSFEPPPRFAGLLRWLPALLPVTVLAAAALWLAQERLNAGLLINRLVIFSLFVLLLAWPVQRVITWLLHSVDPAVPAPAAAAVLALFWLGLLLKGVGMLTPAYMGIDVHWHMDKVRDILYAGALPAYYGTSSPLNDITMPTAEWGTNPPVIPYSPWFHIFATVYAIFPWQMELTASFAALLMDISRIPLLAAMTRRVSGGWRAPLLSAALVAVTPVTFLLHNWGNVPTAAGLWLCWLVIALLWLEWPRLHEPRRQLLLGVLLLLSFLVYTVTGVFMGVLLVVLTLLLAVGSRFGPEWAALRSGLRPLWTAAGAAIALALLVYYGQYIQPIVTVTVPYLVTMLTDGPERVGVASTTFSSYTLGFLPHLGYWLQPGGSLYYGLLLPLLAMPFGYRQLRREPLPWVLASAWGSVALLFFLVGYRVSMVDKQLFFLVPLIALTAGLAADRLWARARWTAPLMLLLLLATLVSALWLWAYRIALSPIYF